MNSEQVCFYNAVAYSIIFIYYLLKNKVSLGLAIWGILQSQHGVLLSLFSSQCIQRLYTIVNNNYQRIYTFYLLFIYLSVPYSK